MATVGEVDGGMGELVTPGVVGDFDVGMFVGDFVTGALVGVLVGILVGDLVTTIAGELVIPPGHEGV